MDAENQLIIRWDNVPHYPQLPNAPFHRHVGTDENVETSPEITLREVLVFIRSKIMEIWKNEYKNHKIKKNNYQQSWAKLWGTLHDISVQSGYLKMA